MDRNTTLVSVAIGSLGGYATAMVLLLVSGAYMSDPSAGSMAGDTPMSGLGPSALAVGFAAGFAPIIGALFVFPVLHSNA